MSSGIVALQSNLLRSSSRAQRCVALSSAEVELSAGSGVLCDCVMLKNALEFLQDVKMPIVLNMDSSGKHIWQRSGCGKMRRPSCRVACVQRAVAEGMAEI